MSCPFNYCDHFGDKEELALMCKICKEEIQRLERYKKEGKDPYAWENVFKDMAKDMALAMAMLEKQAKEMGIDLESLPDEPEPEKPRFERSKIYKIVWKYGEKVEKILKDLEYIPTNSNIQLLRKAVDALSHSRSYVVVKTWRALSSCWEEKHDRFDLELADSKTSAMFAYMAVERNAKALKRLAKHKPLLLLRPRFLKLASVSEKLTELIRDEFFPFDNLILDEFGVDSYNKAFR